MLFLEIVKLLDWYVYDDYFVMVMEYIDEDYKEMFYYIKEYVMFKEDVVKKLFIKVSSYGCNYPLT